MEGKFIFFHPRNYLKEEMSSKKTLFTTELFASLQGEGPKLGTPSIFLRLGLCNLQCTWCDTPYTWKEGMMDCKKRSVEWIIKKINQLRRGKSITNLVVTGGEPLLQQKNLVHLLADDRLADMSIEIETNGSQQLLSGMNLFKKRMNFNISPKLADSGNDPYSVHFYPNSVLKFVYVSKASERLINQFIKENKTEIGNRQIFIMPEGTSVSAMSKKYQDLIGYCLKNGFRFSPRLHIYLFGNKRAT